MVIFLFVFNLFFINLFPSKCEQVRDTAGFLVELEKQFDSEVFLDFIDLLFDRTVDIGRNRIYEDSLLRDLRSCNMICYRLYSPLGKLFSANEVLNIMSYLARLLNSGDMRDQDEFNALVWLFKRS